MKKSIVALLAGVAAALITGCAAPVSPIQSLLPPGNPRNDQNVGPIDGTWAKVATACAAGGAVIDYIKDYTLYVNNQSGELVIKYANPNPGHKHFYVSIPVKFAYPMASEVIMEQDLAGTIECILADTGNKCDSSITTNLLTQLPRVNTRITYQQNGTYSLKAKIFNDFMCDQAVKGTYSSDTTFQDSYLNY